MQGRIVLVLLSTKRYSSRDSPLPTVWGGVGWGWSLRAIQAIDPQSGQLIRLFHPCRDRWSTHFERSPDLVQILGRTAIGRATVLQLRFNERGEMQPKW